MRDFDIKELCVVLGINPDADMENYKVVIQGIDGEIVSETNLGDIFEKLYPLPANLDKINGVLSSPKKAITNK